MYGSWSGVTPVSARGHDFFTQTHGREWSLRGSYPLITLMNATSSHPSNETQAPANTATRDITVLIWDAPVRVFHWLMALCFAGALRNGRGRVLAFGTRHAGLHLAGLVAFRIVWASSVPATHGSHRL